LLRRLWRAQRTAGAAGGGRRAVWKEVAFLIVAYVRSPGSGYWRAAAERGHGPSPRRYPVSRPVTITSAAAARPPRPARKLVAERHRRRFPLVVGGYGLIASIRMSSRAISGDLAGDRFRLAHLGGDGVANLRASAM
jgi:hypothetical protein